MNVHWKELHFEIVVYDKKSIDCVIFCIGDRSGTGTDNCTAVEMATLCMCGLFVEQTTAYLIAFNLQGQRCQYEEADKVEIEFSSERKVFLLLEKGAG